MVDEKWPINGRATGQFTSGLERVGQRSEIETGEPSGGTTQLFGVWWQAKRDTAFDLSSKR